MSVSVDLRTRWKLIVVLGSALTVGGCWRTTGTAGTDPCIIWQPISWSQKDTPQTIEGVKINNARWEGWCKGRR